MQPTKNILPLHMIKVAEDSGIMVEVKSGETYNGILRGVDRFMNIKIGEAVLTDKNGSTFRSIKEAYIRGNTIKYFTFDDDLLAKIEGTEYVCPEKWNKGQLKDRKRKMKS